MTEFKPTDEQLFDYHIGVADYQLNQQIQAYLKLYPAEMNRLKDFENIETAFKSFPITEPSDALVRRVQAMAREELKPGFFSFLGSFSLRRGVAWAAAFVIVIGLSVMMRGLRDTVPYTHSINHAKLLEKRPDGSSKDELKANFSNSKTQSAAQSISTAVDKDNVLVHYSQALGFYHQNQFKQASDLFQKIVTEHPDFSKKQDLYTFWIESLQNIGDMEQVKQRQQEMDAMKLDASEQM